ncbi:MAG: hypothetical protein ABIO57_00920 [Candidatus Paceibacterota bacterium]
MDPVEPKISIETPEADLVEQQHAMSHTYQDDLAKAMNATEAGDVQKMLTMAREQEVEAAIEVTERREKKWYTTSSFILIVLTAAVLAYGTYYYFHLTVPVQPAVSVGVFQSTDPIAIDGTTIKDVLATLKTSTTLVVGKPTLVTLVTDAQTKTPISTTQLYSFIGAAPTEPLQASITSARLGVVNTGQDILPFIVTSISDPEKASNEFTIAEPTLLNMFSLALNIDTSTIPQQPVPVFKSQYFYNLPVRSLYVVDPTTQQQKIVFLYGYATNNVLVITSTPEVLKAVYDTVITQR